VKALSVLYCVGVLAAAASAAVGYHLLHRIPLEATGDGSWDYAIVDSPARRLYVSHNTHVLVVDVDSDKLVGKIDKTDGVHGIALVPEMGRGFISNGRAGTVTIFNPKTLETLGEVKVTGQNPDCIVYDPATHRIFTFNGIGNNATVIDAQEGKVVGTIDLGGRGEFAAVDGKGFIFNNLWDKNLVVKIDSRKLTVNERWPLAPCESPTSMAMDQKNRRLFIGCENRLLAVMDADSGRVITTLPIGDGVDATAWDPETRLILNSTEEGTVAVVRQESPDKYSVLETVKTQYGAKTLALDPKTHQLYVPAAQRAPRPAPTPEHSRVRGAITPGTFGILVLGR
jgi:DNA-binding beta-propeller fold protein YncE